MKVSVKVLVRVRPPAESLSGWVAESFALDATATSGTRAGALSAVKQELELQVGPIVDAHVHAWAESGDAVSCPNGRIELPIDNWICKVTGDRCRAGARVTPADEAHFRSACDAPVDIQDGILLAIRRGDYRGQHHMPGKYLCPLCSSKPLGIRYHYRWELQRLVNVLSIEPSGVADLRVQLILREISPSILSSEICAACACKVAALVAPHQADELETVAVSVDV